MQKPAEPVIILHHDMDKLPDYTKVFYLTDTGRKWNHTGAGIRDRVDSGFDIRVNSTAHLAALAGQGALPDQVMITVHPQRWYDRSLPWIKELVWQNEKSRVRPALLSLLGGWVLCAIWVAKNVCRGYYRIMDL